MSHKETCPACRSHTSAVAAAFADGDPCPTCGLSADAAAEVRDAQRRNADAELTKQYSEVVIRADKAEARVRVLEEALETVQQTLREALGHE